MTEIISMGGYGVYVWPSYAVFLLVLIGNVIAPWRERRRALRDAAELGERQRRPR